MPEQEQPDQDAVPMPGRPRMAPGYGVKRDATEGVLPWSFVTERMTRSRSYWVVTTRPNGHPHAAPVWGVWLGGAFYFATDRASRKARNLAAGPWMVVHLESGDEVVILEGRVEEVTEASVRARFADAYDVKYHFRPDTGGAAPLYRLKVHATYAWLEREFPTTATRWTFEQG